MEPNNAPARGRPAVVTTHHSSKLEATAKTGYDFSRIPLFAQAPKTFQSKLTVNEPGDKYEREADRLAARVMSSPDPTIQMKSACSCDGGCSRYHGQMERAGGVAAPVRASPAPVQDAISSSGRPLDVQTREFMESRLGHDFSRIRVHTGARANEAGRALGARAFTTGNSIVFSSGSYAPNQSDGKRLLAHELVHVVQQQQKSQVPAVQRQSTAGPIFDLLEAIGKYKLDALLKKPGPKASYTHPTNKCGEHFCQPFNDRSEAKRDLAWAGPLLLAGIATKVNPRVVPLWFTYLAGGSGLQDLTSTFGKDFTNSPTSYYTTLKVASHLSRDILKNHADLIPDEVASATIDFTNMEGLKEAKADISKMNFNKPADIAGNVAGGVGHDQAALKNQIGNHPSKFPDGRKATIKAILTRQEDGRLLVEPTFDFVVVDTIDLCPGDCGTTDEQVATIPLSRFEATGLVGDVQFVIRFPSPKFSFVVETGATPSATGTATSTESGSSEHR